jgi:hypothetical protein
VFDGVGAGNSEIEVARVRHINRLSCPNECDEVATGKEIPENEENEDEFVVKKLFLI